MRKPRLRSVAVIPAIGVALLVGPSGGPVGAEQLDPAVSFEAWYFRAKPAQQVVALAQPSRSKQTHMIGGTPAEAARELVKRLREEARAL